MIEQCDVVDALYQAALFPEHWPSAIGLLSGLAGATGGIVFLNNNLAQGGVASEHMGAILHDFLAQDWMTRNTRTPMLLGLPPVRFYQDAEVFDDRALLLDPMQAELLVPAGFGREVATRIVTLSGENAIISLHKPFASGRYDADGMAGLDAVRPHLQRALALAARLGLQRLHGAMDVLNAVGLAAAVVNRDGVVLASNSRLEREPALQAAAFSRLGFRLAGARQAFRDALAGLDRSPVACGPPIALRGPDGSPASVLQLVPLRLGARDLMSGAVAIVLVTPLAAISMPDMQALRTMFGLTTAEARVARGLMTATVDQIADAGSVSINTVRTQVKAVLRKTNSRSQVELSGLLSRLARLDLADGGMGRTPAAGVSGAGAARTPG